MRSSGGHPWRGFERAPLGCLFEQRIDVAHDMGVAYERSHRYAKPMHVHDRLLLVFPRSATSMRVTIADPAQAFDVTSGDVLIVPAGVLHDDRWITEVYDTFALLPSATLLERVAGSSSGPRAALERVRLVPRTAWLDALLEEYFVDRVLRSCDDGPRNAALEELILLEVLRLASAGEHEPDDASDASAQPESHAPPGPDSVVARALRHLEANLFADVDLETLCRVVGASRSSLIRHFKRELGTTPNAYLLGRRLDEAKRLLVSGRHGVAEVAHLVGYDNHGAFSSAFRRRFGTTPKLSARG